MSDGFTRKEKRDIVAVANAMLDDKRKDDEERGNITYGISLARLRELAEAERNGTNWIMPCKRGDTVYRIVGQKGKKRVGSRTVLSVTKYDTSVSVFTTVSDTLGKTVFLTQAEAARALAATEPEGGLDGK